MRIYTRTGDAGETGLIGGGRISKVDARMAAIGDVDELNAALGVSRLYSAGTTLDDLLARVQNLLFEVGAELATPADSQFVNQVLSDAHVVLLEHSMDTQNETLEPLRQFILPGGSPLGAHLHLARTVCRRAERTVLRFSEQEPVRDEVLKFLNRLSDWLFVAARTANATASVPDVKWKSEG